ncbi:MAG: hypothetical protein J7M18_02820 [Candidatus Eremiobacteraeota bacterium]|nr:hypothetical protein [Candidatus Eremiobacteraeota bacterium]
MKIFRVILWFLVILSVIVSFWNIIPRYRVEEANRNVDIVLDDPAFIDYCKLTGKDEREVLYDFKSSGVSALAISEDRLKDLQDRGKILCYNGQELESTGWGKKIKENFPDIEIKPDRIYVIILVQDTASQLSKYLPVILPDSCYKKLLPWKDGSPGIVEVDVPNYFFNEVGVGFDPARIRLAKEFGLNIIFRPENKDNFDDAKTRAYIDTMYSQAEPACLIFGGIKNEVLGFPGGLKQLIKSIDEHGIHVCHVEVANRGLEQRGIAQIARARPGSIIRLISFSPLYQAKLHPEVVREKYVLAVTDRNIRVLYCRPFLQPMDGKSLDEVNNDYFKGLSDALKSAGFNIGDAVPFGKFHPHSWMIILIIIGISAGWAIYLGELIPWEKIWLIVIVGLLLPVFLFLIFFFAGNEKFAVKLFALGSGIIFSSMGFVVFRERLLSFINKENPVFIFGRGILILFGITVITLIGAVHITALLSSTLSAVGADMMRGIKLLLVMPALLVIAAYARRGFPDPVTFKQVMFLPVSLWHILLAILGTVFTTAALLRSGNIPAEYRLSMEAKIRSVLDRVLIARPRFKEFLIGHPALIILPFAVARNRFTTAWALLIAGVLGQANIVDTFAHLHTPLLMSLLRTINGLWVGLVPGIIGSFIYWKLTQRRK